MSKSSTHPSLVINATVMATVSTVLPGFLIGAMSVQVSAEMGVSEAAYGWGLGSFFGAAMLGSILLGRLSQRIGALSQTTLALGLSAAAQLALAATARSFGAVIAFLVVAGLCNAANQASVNLAWPRLGCRGSVWRCRSSSRGCPRPLCWPGLRCPLWR